MNSWSSEGWTFEESVFIATVLWGCTANANIFGLFVSDRELGTVRKVSVCRKRVLDRQHEPWS